MNKTRRKVVAGLIVWTFIHLFFLIKAHYILLELDTGSYSDQWYKKYTPIFYNGYEWTGSQQTPIPNEVFFPFFIWSETKNPYVSLFDYLKWYDFTEFFVYVAGAWMIFYLYQYINKKE